MLYIKPLQHKLCSIDPSKPLSTFTILINLTNFCKLKNFLCQKFWESRESNPGQNVNLCAMLPPDLTKSERTGGKVWHTGIDRTFQSAIPSLNHIAHFFSQLLSELKLEIELIQYIANTSSKIVSGTSKYPNECSKNIVYRPISLKFTLPKMVQVHIPRNLLASLLLLGDEPNSTYARQVLISQQ